MVIAHPLPAEEILDTPDELPRRPATVQSLDARLSVWGQAAREAVERRAEALARGACLYVQRVGRNSEILRQVPLDHRMALLSTETDVLVLVSASLIPQAVKKSCRLLWVDPEKLFEHIMGELQPAIDGSRAEIRRRQALYRRRARLWQHDAQRLGRLREEVESLRVPRCGDNTPDLIARGLLIRHREDANLGYAPATEPEKRAKLQVRAGSISRWIDQIDASLDGV
jgi:hypothetical protein